jgi:hypothetical protein
VSVLRLLLLPAALGCSSSGVEDAGFEDGGFEDAGFEDAEPIAEAGASDAGQGGFGAIMGACGVLDSALTSSSASTVSNSIDFGTDPYDDSDAPRLTAGGREILSDGNAGGSSLFSELFAYEVLARCEGAELLKTETEVVYTDPMGKITDLLVSIDGLKIGVSVTRAVSFPRDASYTPQDALPLIQRKLEDILVSTANVAAEDRWVKQILHVIAYDQPHADSVFGAYELVDPNTRSDTILIVTRSDGDDEFIY